MIELTQSELTLTEVHRLVYGIEKLALSASVWERIDRSYRFLDEFAEGKVIYGINTGFGPMAQVGIKPSQQRDLQLNLIRSHASGMGELLSPDQIKATMVARLNTLSLGYSGIHPSAVSVLLDMINTNIFPAIYTHGGVGASGDLVQLAHLALAMIGEGNVWDGNTLRPANEALQEAGITPMKIFLREGLAIMNGTSAMSGMGILNNLSARRAIEWSTVCTAMICESIDSYTDYFSEELNATKKHPGQRVVARAIKNALDSGKYGRSRENGLYAEQKIDHKVQEYYSLRCAPQILGPIFDSVQSSGKTIQNEINSANDNPIIDPKNQNVYHGGNFHGDYVAFEMDKLRMGIAKLSVLAERQLNFLMNPALNQILPPFLNAGQLGFNFGMQGMQFAATSTTAENQTIAASIYIHSIPNNNDNQDVVSMGANASLLTARAIENVFEILSIELLAAVQAVEILEKYKGMSPLSKSAFDKVRGIFPHWKSDAIPSEKLGKIKDFIRSNSPEGLNLHED